MPDIDSLGPIGRAALAKSLPLSKPASSKFTDLFSKLVPMAVHNALQAYESRKGEIVNFEVGRLREGTQLMNRFELAICWKHKQSRITEKYFLLELSHVGDPTQRLNLCA